MFQTFLQQLREYGIPVAVLFVVFGAGVAVGSGLRGNVADQNTADQTDSFCWFGGSACEHYPNHGGNCLAGSTPVEPQDCLAQEPAAATPSAQPPSPSVPAPSPAQPAPDATAGAPAPTLFGGTTGGDGGTTGGNGASESESIASESSSYPTLASADPAACAMSNPEGDQSCVTCCTNTYWDIYLGIVKDQPMTPSIAKQLTQWSNTCNYVCQQAGQNGACKVPGSCTAGNVSACEPSSCLQKYQTGLCQPDGVTCVTIFHNCDDASQCDSAKSASASAASQSASEESMSAESVSEESTSPAAEPSVSDQSASQAFSASESAAASVTSQAASAPASSSWWDWFQTWLHS